MENSSSPQEWVERYGDMLFQYTLARVNDRELAEDLVQDCFLSALKARGKFREESTEKTWLFAILKNKIIDHYRRRARKIETEGSTYPDEDLDFFTEEGGWQRDRMPAAWDADRVDIENKELGMLLHHCKNGLKNLVREVYILKYLEDMAPAEICKVLNISSSNYWILLHRARLQMRECIEKKWIK